ncbi:MAG: hypothetical protein LUG95_02895 [Clostridiales bacterium]|nr:hypothetical protein [Clostridiales bacterium]
MRCLYKSKPCRQEQNCFVVFCAEVKEYLISGKNEIKILFHSPVVYVDKMQRECPAPVNSNGRNGVAHIRKPQCHFGWDWGPVLSVSGISAPVYLCFTDTARIDYLKVTQSHFADGSVVVRADADIKSFGEYDCDITLISPNGEEYKRQGESAEFKISNPCFWQTRELLQKEKQPLYTVKATLTANGKLLDEKSKRIGLRTLELNRDKDKYGQNFQFILNSVPVFIKGADYIPPDSFITRFDTQKLSYLLDAVQFSGMNMLRIWGGGYYASNEFLDVCDEQGILVWQDFQFAFQAYPFFRDDFLDNVKDEIEYNVKRISHHPSLALWCGNNEIEQMQSAWLHMKKYIDCTESFFTTRLKLRSGNTIFQLRILPVLRAE